MQLNVPPAPPPAPMPGGGSQNPYDFILSGKSKQRPGFGGGSVKQRLIIVAIGGGLLLIAAIILVSIISGGSKGGTEALVNLAQQQTEIARVAAIGEDKASSSDTKNLAITTELSMQSSAGDTVALLKKSGHKIGDKTLALLQSSKTDDELNAAAANNTFDDTFTKLIQSELVSYRTSLQNAYRNATKTSEQQLLQTSFNSATVIIGDQTST